MEFTRPLGHYSGWTRRTAGPAHLSAPLPRTRSGPTPHPRPWHGPERPRPGTHGPGSARTGPHSCTGPLSLPHAGSESGHLLPGLPGQGQAARRPHVARCSTTHSALRARLASRDHPRPAELAHPRTAPRCFTPPSQRWCGLLHQRPRVRLMRAMSPWTNAGAGTLAGAACARTGSRIRFPG